MKISKYFDSEEFYVSSQYPKLAAEIKRTKQDLEKSHRIVWTILNPVREHFKMAIRANSGKRSKVLNLVVGGVPSSEHRWIGQACAVDWEFIGDKMMLWKAYEWIEKNLTYSFGQLIIYLTKNGTPQFIHTSVSSQSHQGETLVKHNNIYYKYEDWKRQRRELLHKH